MTRAFSLSSESLSYFIGFALLHSGSTIIVSPWLSDVMLRIPLNNRFEGREIRLLKAIEEFDEKDIHLVVRTGEHHNKYIKNRLPDHATLHEIDDLHAKAVICDEFVYLGSANITHGGLTLNRELCEVIENDHESARAYVKANLGFDVH